MTTTPYDDAGSEADAGSGGPTVWGQAGSDLPNNGVIPRVAGTEGVEAGHDAAEVER